jgi:hypothetical protein
MTRYSERRICLSCRARIKLGEPSPGAWATIDMDSLALRRLYEAAAEYVGLCRDAGETPDVIEFLDWLSPSVSSSDRNTGRTKVAQLRGAA